tara:strand:- start:1800 stop:2756 length:957 start_codon:yes stop_codon:yes gene_type:complete
MSNTSDFNLANQVGSTFRTELNLVLGDIQSSNSGSSDPSTTVAYKIWADTANNLLKIRNGSNNGWLTLGDLTDANNLGLATKASPSFTGTVTSAGDIVMSGNGSLQLPVGTTAQRPTAATGDIRFNTSTTAFEGYNGSIWGDLAAGVPIGTVLSFAANTPPSGFLECNGANVSRSTYASLFSTVGTSFGIGDGSSTFGLPDLRGQFVRGWVSNGSVDSGRTFGSTQTDQNKNHTHTTDSHNLTGSVSVLSATLAQNPGTATGVFSKGTTQAAVGAPSGGSGSASALDFSGAHTHTVSSSGGGAENRPTNVALMYVIKF